MKIKLSWKGNLEMRVHVIIDFMHIYYKYYFQVKEGKLKKLSYAVLDDRTGITTEMDTTLIYYPLHDIEGIRTKLEKLGHEVTISVCMDSPSRRKDMGIEGSEEYKSGRKKELSDNNFKDLETIQNILEHIGYNVYKVDGYEADDLVNYLVRKFSNNENSKFDYTLIYTNDKDLLININSRVGVERFKQYKGYTYVNISNYETYLNNEFGTYIPYNALGLYLCTVGDRADKVKGIYRFGNAAFNKLMNNLNKRHNIDWKTCGDYDILSDVTLLCKEYLTDKQFEEMRRSFVLVANMELVDDLKEPIKNDSQALRSEVYTKYGMFSLCI